MKVRSGFISNSSSSSFLMYGIWPDNDIVFQKEFVDRLVKNFPDKFSIIVKNDGKEYLKYLRNKFKEVNILLDFFEEYRYRKMYKNFDDTYDFMTSDFIPEIIEIIFGNEYFVTYPYDTSGGCAIGKSWHKIGDDETGREFKESIENNLKKVFGEDISFDTYQEAWFDG